MPRIISGVTASFQQRFFSKSVCTITLSSVFGKSITCVTVSSKGVRNTFSGLKPRPYRNLKLVLIRYLCCYCLMWFSLCYLCLYFIMLKIKVHYVLLIVLLCHIKKHICITLDKFLPVFLEIPRIALHLHFSRGDSLFSVFFITTFSLSLSLSLSLSQFCIFTYIYVHDISNSLSQIVPYIAQ